jgi:predicted nucleotidyltransferase
MAHMAHVAQQHAAMQYAQGGGAGHTVQHQQGSFSSQQQHQLYQQHMQAQLQAGASQYTQQPSSQAPAVHAYSVTQVHSASHGYNTQPYPGAFEGGVQDLQYTTAPSAPQGSPAKARSAAARSVLASHPAVDAAECVAAYEEEGHLDLSVAHGLCAAESNILLHITAEEPESGCDSVALYRLGHAVSALAHGRVGGNESSPDALEAAARKYIVLKSLSTLVRAAPRNGGAYTRFLKFRAPRGHGVYVFRYFDGEEFDKTLPPSSMDDLDVQFGMVERVPPPVGHSTILRVVVQGDALKSALLFCQSQLQDAFDAHSDTLVLMQEHSLWLAQQTPSLDTSSVGAALSMSETLAEAGDDMDFEPSSMMTEEHRVEDMRVRTVCGVTIPVLVRKMGLAAGGALASLHALLHQTLVPPSDGAPVWCALRLACRLVALQRVLYSAVMELERLVLEGVAAAKTTFDADSGADIADTKSAEETAFGAALGVLEDVDDDVVAGGTVEAAAGRTVPLSSLFEPTMWLQRDALACSASLVAAMDDVIGNAQLLGCLTPPQRLRLLQLRAQVCPFTDTLLTLPREISPPMLSTADDPAPQSDGQALCHPADGFSPGKMWRQRVLAAVVASVQSVHQATAVQEGAPAPQDMPTAAIVQALVPPAQLPEEVIAAVDAMVLSVAPAMFPGPDFVAKRNDVVQRVQALTRRLSRVASQEYSARCSVFGSSANGFGSPSSDVDLALEVSRSGGDEASAWSVTDLLSELEGLLQAAGMEEVVSRGTARVPLVKFLDPTSGLEVDIGLNNVLAQRNTALLRAYATLDPVNVRCLGYVIKSWAKARDLNDPVTGTLSSYAWLLCLLSFLQRRPAKQQSVRGVSAAGTEACMLPCLQALPPAGTIASGQAQWNWEDWTRWGGSITTARDVPPSGSGQGQRPSAFVVYTGAPGSSHTGFVEHNGPGHAGSAGTALGTSPTAAGAWDAWRRYVRNPDGVACDTYFAEEGSAAFAAAAVQQAPRSQHRGELAGPSCGRLLLEFFWHFAFQADTRRAVVTARATPPPKIASAVPRAVEQLLAAQAAHDNIVQTVKRNRKDSGRGGRRGGGIPAPPQLPMDMAAAAFRFGVCSPVPTGASPLQASIAGSTACEPLKSWKSSMEGWSNKPTLAVEDPMETAYNVAHVLKPSQHHRMRAEMARAYVALVAAAQGVAVVPAACQLAEDVQGTLAGVAAGKLAVHSTAAEALGIGGSAAPACVVLAPDTIAAIGRALFALRPARVASLPALGSKRPSIAACALGVLPAHSEEDWAMPPPHEDVQVLAPQSHTVHGHVLDLVLPSGAHTVWESSAASAAQVSSTPAGTEPSLLSTQGGDKKKNKGGGRTRRKGGKAAGPVQAQSGKAAGSTQSGKAAGPVQAQSGKAAGSTQSGKAAGPLQGGKAAGSGQGGKAATLAAAAPGKAPKAAAKPHSGGKSTPPPKAVTPKIAVASKNGTESKAPKRTKRSKPASAATVASAGQAAAAGMLPPTLSHPGRARNKRATKPKVEIT